MSIRAIDPRLEKETTLSPNVYASRLALRWRRDRATGLALTFKLNIELGTEEEAEGRQPKPHEQHRDDRQTPVVDAVACERAHVRSKEPGNREPCSEREEGSWPMTLLDVGRTLDRVAIEHAEEEQTQPQTEYATDGSYRRFDDDTKTPRARLGVLVS